MAEAEQISLVRAYTGEETEDNWTDAQLGTLVDELGVEAATARVWREKAARYSRLVDVAEAGASRKMSQAFDHATTMAARWDAIAAEATSTGTSRSAQVHKIVRS